MMSDRINFVYYTLQFAFVWPYMLNIMLRTFKCLKVLKFLSVNIETIEQFYIYN